MSGNMPSALIVGCAGESLTDAECAFFREIQPWGFILFARNCNTPEQVKALTTQMRALTGRIDTPILIDQEGGRVMRLKPPLWPNRPSMDRFGALLAHDQSAAKQAAYLGARLIAEDLSMLGINVNCVPMVDVPQPGANEAIIGDRVLARTAADIVLLAQEVIAGSLAGGVLPIIKHIPGHGRAVSDSHFELPVVSASQQALRETDFAPFKALAAAPMAMTAHVIYEAFDSKRPATVSPVMIADIIRGEIGFDGLLMTDDLSMKALSGDFATRSSDSLAAGCDMLLHCNGDFAEMQAIAAVTPILSGKAMARAARALSFLGRDEPIDRAVEEKHYAEILKPVMA